MLGQEHWEEGRGHDKSVSSMQTSREGAGLLFERLKAL